MRFHVSALALAALAMAAPAAASKDEAPQVTVQYQDLDLTTDAGQKELDRRLDNAAREVCGMSERIVGSRLPTRGSRDCYQQTRGRLAEQFAALIERKTRGG